jgi:hypothetical protein
VSRFFTLKLLYRLEKDEFVHGLVVRDNQRTDLYSYPITDLDRPSGIQFRLLECLDNWRMKVARLSALHTGCL